MRGYRVLQAEQKWGHSLHLKTLYIPESRVVTSAHDTL